MEEKQYAKAHKLLLNNRRTGTVSGVTDVISFDIAEILLETEQGMLTIKGSDLHVNRLTLEKGEVDIEGRIDSMAYSEVTDFHKAGASLLGRLLSEYERGNSSGAAVFSPGLFVGGGSDSALRPDPPDKTPDPSRDLCDSGGGYFILGCLRNFDFSDALSGEQRGHTRLCHRGSNPGNDFVFAI